MMRLHHRFSRKLLTRRRHRQTRFAGTGGPTPMVTVFFSTDAIYSFWPKRFRLHRAALAEMHSTSPPFADLLLFAGADHVDDIADVLLSQAPPPGGTGSASACTALAACITSSRLAADPQLAVPVGHRHIKFLFQQADVLVKGAENIDSACSIRSMLILCSMPSLLKLSDAPSGSFAV